MVLLAYNPSTKEVEAGNQQLKVVLNSNKIKASTDHLGILSQKSTIRVHRLSDVMALTKASLLRCTAPRSTRDETRVLYIC